MRPSSLILIFLFLLHLLFSAAYATRIAKFGTKSAKTLQVHLEANNEKVHAQKQDDSNRVEQVNIRVTCKDEIDECARSQGKNRKQVASTSMSTSAYIPIQEDLEKGVNKDMLKSRMNEVEHRPASLSSSTLSTENDGEEVKKQKKRGKRHEDLMDMIEMDYSPAMKKPPIHN